MSVIRYKFNPTKELPLPNGLVKAIQIPVSDNAMKEADNVKT